MVLRIYDDSPLWWLKSFEIPRYIYYALCLSGVEYY
jgi:hypothetical protein